MDDNRHAIEAVEAEVRRWPIGVGFDSWRASAKPSLSNLAVSRGMTAIKTADRQKIGQLHSAAVPT